MARLRPTVVIVPSEVVDFSSGPSSIAYHNLSSRQAVAFRVMFTSPELLTAVPAEGMVPPGKHVEIILTPVDASESSRLPHRVIVRTLVVPSQQQRAAPNGQMSLISQLWASAGTDGSSGVEEHLLSCVRDRAPTGTAAASAEAGDDVRLLSQREAGAQALLAACERLLLLRTSQLAAAEHALVVERNAAAGRSAASASTSADSSAATSTAAGAGTACAAAAAAAATAAAAAATSK